MSAYQSIARRSVIEQSDYRSDEQKLADLLDEHLSNVDALNSAPSDELIFGRAQSAYEDTQAQLWRLIEDMLCVDPRKLGRALNA
jgi:hypothetical protein